MAAIVTELQNNFLIVADTHRQNLYHVGLDHVGVFPLLPTDTTINPVAVTYDEIGREVYWTDVKLHFIAKYSLTTESVTKLYEDRDGSYFFIDWAKFEESGLNEKLSAFSSEFSFYQFSDRCFPII